jgi:hypothetical protein
MRVLTMVVSQHSTQKQRHEVINHPSRAACAAFMHRAFTGSVLHQLTNENDPNNAPLRHLQTLNSAPSD